MREADHEWRWMVGVTAKRAWGDRPPLKSLVHLQWEFWSRTSPGDLDNLLKNALDMMRPAGLVLDDNCTRVPSLNAKWHRAEGEEGCAMTMIWRSEVNPMECSPGTEGPWDLKAWPPKPKRSRKEPSS